jgi:hypothetical protein
MRNQGVMTLLLVVRGRFETAVIKERLEVKYPYTTRSCTPNCKPIVAQLVKKFTAFMKPEGSLPRS